MNAIQILRQMHADTKVRFKVILSAEDPAEARREWHALQPLLDLHEQLEDQFVYTPLAEEMGPYTPLGDWDVRHEADVVVVKQLIGNVEQFTPASPEWRMAVAQVNDALVRHVMDEEGQIFGRIEQVWPAERLEAVGAAMLKAKDGAAKPAKPVRARATATRSR